MDIVTVAEKTYTDIFKTNNGLDKVKSIRIAIEYPIGDKTQQPSHYEDLIEDNTISDLIKELDFNFRQQFREQNVGEVTLGYHCPESVCPGKEVMPKKLQEAEGALSSESEGEGTQDTESVNNLAPECPLEDKGTASSDSEEEVIQDQGVDDRLSKTLIYVLRHGASKSGDSRHPGLSGYTLKELTRLVEVDVDKRFTLERDPEHGWWKIKANQGHSINVGSFGMPSVEENTVAHAYHYTTMLAWGDIEEEGLRRMNRQHIHLLSEVPPTFKPHWEVQIMIDVPRAQAEGYEFFWAPSRAILCPGGPWGEERGEIPGSLWFEHEDLGLTEDTSPAEVTMASYGELQESFDSTEGHSPPRAVSTIDTALESNEEAHNSGDSSSEGEVETTLVDEESEIVTVCQLRSGTVFRVPIKVQGQSLFAVVDTAAKVTLISEEVYRSLNSVPPILREVIMNTAGKGMQMNGYVVGSVNLELGSKLIQTNLYVAPIEDMLLGFDLLRAHCIDLQMSEGQLRVGDEVIPMTMGKVGQAPRVDKHVHVRQGELIAQAEVETIEVPAKVRVVGIGVGTGPTESDQGVPEHLRDLFDRSKALMGSQEALASLLREYGDVFAASEFD
ncbi:TRPT1 [Mytilus coruscus]|uniref:TRPT1 n=1 Tax=Mytilus coruscus TaxID=42192 RepID=A0A6J8C7B8_MYTCO|nr:TRPT1 [Mytilus coruscus]